MLNDESCLVRERNIALSIITASYMSAAAISEVLRLFPAVIGKNTDRIGQCIHRRSLDINIVALVTFNSLHEIVVVERLVAIILHISSLIVANEGIEVIDIVYDSTRFASSISFTVKSRAEGFVNVVSIT